MLHQILAVVYPHTQLLPFFAEMFSTAKTKRQVPRRRVSLKDIHTRSEEKKGGETHLQYTAKSL